MKSILLLFYQVLAITGYLKKPALALQPTQKSDNPLGRWERTLKDGGVWIWLISTDGTFSVFSKGKGFVKGQYRVANVIYDVNDPNCNNAYHGRYRFSIKHTG